mmetsp:Transcript_24352/g.55555  ORF Transcript_24352/g.55555 Transcript_24352/m.55555 type:complete len:271 (-) Transcript_24352:1114-1926(-)
MLEFISLLLFEIFGVGDAQSRHRKGMCGVFEVEVDDAEASFVVHGDDDLPLPLLLGLLFLILPPADFLGGLAGVSHLLGQAVEDVLGAHDLGLEVDGEGELESGVGTLGAGISEVAGEGLEDANAEGPSAAVVLGLGVFDGVDVLAAPAHELLVHGLLEDVGGVSEEGLRGGWKAWAEGSLLYLVLLLLDDHGVVARQVFGFVGLSVAMCHESLFRFEGLVACVARIIVGMDGIYGYFGGRGELFAFGDNEGVTGLIGVVAKERFGEVLG